MALSDVFSNPLLVATGPAIVTGVAAWLLGKQQISQLKAELTEKNEALAAEKKRSLKLIEAAKDKVGSPENAESNRQQAVELLNDIISETGAERATLYTPLEGNEGQFLGLVVLATAPNDLANTTFEGTVFSTRESSAVDCFLAQRPKYAAASNYKYDGYKPGAMFADVIAADSTSRRQSPFGVVQVLTEKRQIDQDKASKTISRFRGPLAEACENFIGPNQRNLDLVGFRIPPMSNRGSVMIFDISNSAELFFDDRKGVAVVEFMNAFAAKAHRICATRGGIFEGFTGDGFVYAFPAPAPNSGDGNPFEAAVSCAMDIIGEFEKTLSAFRADLDATGSELHPRIGISSGIVHPIYLSSEQMRTTSIFGKTPSIAGTICNCGRRDRPELLIDSATHSELGELTQRAFSPAPDIMYSDKSKRYGIKIYAFDA